MIRRRLLPGLVVALVVLYAATPLFAQWLLPQVLARSGVDASHFSFGYPSWRGVDVASFDMRVGNVEISGERAHIGYRLGQLLRGRCDAVTLARLTVRLRGDSEAAEAGGPLELPRFWALVPAERVSIDALDLASEDPVAEAHGTLRFDPDVLEARLDVASPLLSVPLSLAATTYPDGRFAVAVQERDAAAPLLSLRGTPDAGKSVLAIDGRLALGGTPLALAAAYAHTTLSSGSVQVQVQGSAPWPVPADAAWRAITATGRYAVSLQGEMPAVQALDAQFSGDFNVAGGAIAVQLDAGSVLKAEQSAVAAVRRLTLTADTAVGIDYGEQGLRVGDGLVLSTPAAESTVAVRLRGARGSDGRIEFVVTSLEGAPVLLATAQGIEQYGTTALAVHTHLALTGKLFGFVATTLGVSGSAGHLVAEFDGSVSGPADALDLQNISGKGRVELALTGRAGPTRTFDTAVDGEYAVQRGRLAVTLAPGARLSLASDGVEATTIGALAIEGRPTEQRIASPVDIRIALPDVAVGKRKVMLANAWVTLDHVTRDGDAVAVGLVARTHKGRDAQPIKVTLDHDLATGVGRFAVTADWQTKKALLAAQLPGFNAPYDLDEGALQIALKGSWDSAKTPALRATGHVKLDGRRAHYEDYAVTGVTADLPIALDGAAYTVAETPVAIDTVDVGFPLTQISLRLAVADGIAQVRDLKGRVLGGQFAADPFGYTLATDESTVALHLTAVDLAELLALEGEDVQGSGILDGELPVRTAGEVVTVDAGRIAARAPGGKLVYKSAPSMAMQTGMGFVFQALEDFRYDVLDAKVDLATDGALVLAVRLQGRNPAVENGRTIAFNLNLNESLPALLQSLRAAEGVTKRIEGKLSQ